MMPAGRKNAVRKESLWIYRPSLDLVVGCGAWSVPLLLLAYFTSASSTLTWSIAFYVLALFFNYPHYMATIYRAYHTEEDFNKYRIFTVHITLLVALTILLSHVWVQSLPWIFTLYLTISPWHYSGQNYGLCMMFARRAGAAPAPRQRRALYAAFLISYGVLLANSHTGRSTDPLFVSLNLPEKISFRLQIALAAAFFGCAAYGLRGLWKQVGAKKLVPSLTLFSTQCVWFVIPPLLSWFQPFQIPLSRYSTGVLAVMHSAQYLWITSYYAKRETSAGTSRTWRPVAYFTVLMAGGVALFIPGPWLASRVFHFDFTRSFLLFTALVNIHHFLLDGAIWKLRDGRIAALLVHSRAEIAQEATAAGSRTMSGLRWLAGPSARARRLRTAAACLLLTWACVDQVRYYFAVHHENLADLKLAAALAPYDTPLELRLARQAMQQGDPQESIHAWQYAIQADPRDRAARDAWLRYLTEQHQVDEAYRRTGEWLKTAPKDASLLINHGILAQQSGHAEEAESSWEKALQADPSQADADLYLALDLETKGKLAEAIPHYEAYLTKMVGRPAPALPPAANLIDVAMKLADCNARLDRFDLALKYYKMARTLAAQTRQTNLESLADVSEAALRMRIGADGARGDGHGLGASGKGDGSQILQALALYQDALRLDARVDDRHSEAVDWYAYATFLQKEGFPAKFVYAGFVKSEGLFTEAANAQQAATAGQVRKKLERQLGTQAAAIRENPEPTLHEALLLTR